MRKNLFFYLLFFIILILISACSCIAKNNVVDSDDEKTLRQQILLQYEKTTWLPEIHAGGIPEKQTTTTTFLIPDVLAALVTKTDVYPYLEGFGSLDTSGIPSEILDLLDLFFSMAVLPEKPNRSIDNSLLTQDLDFLPIILTYHFSRLHAVKYTLYGEAIELENSFQIPVRFQGEDRYTDANLFVSKAELSYLIDQIQFATTIIE
ncbi:MAG: hypothetical protein ACRC5H_07495 [Treponemataceae bacterium]